MDITEKAEEIGFLAEFLSGDKRALLEQRSGFAILKLIFEMAERNKVNNLKNLLKSWVIGCESNKDYAVWCAPYALEAIKLLGFANYQEFLDSCESDTVTINTKTLDEMNAQEIWDELMSNDYDPCDENSCEAFMARLEYFGNAVRRGDEFIVN